MKTIIDSWFWAILLCATFGLAPWFPEPHIWGKLRWIEGGAINMKLLDWLDFFFHSLPFLLLLRLFLIKIGVVFKKSTMKKFFSALAPLAFLITFSGRAEAQDFTSQIPPAAFETQLEAWSDEYLIDVRTLGEFEKGHLAGAENVDFYAPDFRKKLDALDRSRPVFVYCAVGGRSKATTRILADMGFMKIYELLGGYQQWLAAEKPIEK